MKPSVRFFCLILVVCLALCGLVSAAEQKPKVLVLTGARLIDGNGGAPVDDAVVVITGDRFTAVGVRGKVAVPRDAEVLDVKGKTVIPGLIDAHMHFSKMPTTAEAVNANAAITAFRSAQMLRLCLEAGITTVRDVGAFENVSLMARQAFNSGALVGSRPIVCGQGITSLGGHSTEKGVKGSMEADGADGFRMAVRAQLRDGADIVKILCPYSRDEIFAAVEESHLHEKFVTVHPSQFKAQYDFLRWAIEAGADCFEHAYAVPDDMIPQIAAKKMYCVPTMAILVVLADQYRPRGPEWDWKVRKYMECDDIFKKLKAAGVKMAVGTDAVYENMVEYPGIYFKETDRFVLNGCTPMETIVAATKIGAEVSDADEILGTIEPGKLADCLVLDKDPLADIRNLRTAQVIIQGGKFVKR